MKKCCILHGRVCVMSATCGGSRALELKGREGNDTKFTNYSFIYLFASIYYLYIINLHTFCHVGCSACYVIGGGL